MEGEEDMNKYIIVTVDTEGDNLWDWKPGQEITTENTRYIPRFQELCEKYGIVPVYLTNYEMVCDKRLVKYLKQKSQNKLCEIGMHLHAWNTPPEYPIENVYGGNPYIVEYPLEIMEEKSRFILDLLEKSFEEKIITHRSGRWSLNDEYLKILKRIGIKIDCSVTPMIDWSGNPGSSKKNGPNYKNYPRTLYQIIPGIWEVPMSTRKFHNCTGDSVKRRIKNLVLGKDIWLRPFGKTTDDLFYMQKAIEKEGQCDYLEFMIHSSELMPGGSPYFKREEDVELMFRNMEQFFATLIAQGYKGTSLKEYVGGKISVN